MPVIVGTGVTAVMLRVALLFAPFASGVVVATEAFTFPVDAVAGHATSTVTAIDAALPAGSDAAEQLTAPEAPGAGVVHVQPAGARIDVNDVCNGRAVVTVTAAAGAALMFDTTSVYVSGVPAVIFAGASIEIATSVNGASAKF
jgi:hypothetical protein